MTGGGIIRWGRKEPGKHQVMDTERGDFQVRELVINISHWCQMLSQFRVGKD